jgi:tRNA U34 5-methylaminomethyl-2-thiouridine-forming methyltransferase MnmC
MLKAGPGAINPELRITGDGSHTLYIPGIDEHYHSHFGAITESRHIFIRAGLASIEKNDISILEVGFGTGLNALLTAIYAADNHKNIVYVTLEQYPLSPDILKALNYGSLAGGDGQEIFNAIHAAPWDEASGLSPWFTIEKRLLDLTSESPEGIFDLVYFDAFGPDKQPEMWTMDVISRIAAVTHSGTVLVTYSAKGTLKRMLRLLDFDVKLIPGPPGKRVMTRATKR